MPHILASAKPGEIMFRVWEKGEFNIAQGPVLITTVAKTHILGLQYDVKKDCIVSHDFVYLYFKFGDNYSYSPEIWAIFEDLLGPAVPYRT